MAEEEDSNLGSTQERYSLVRVGSLRRNVENMEFATSRIKRAFDRFSQFRLPSQISMNHRSAVLTLAGLASHTDRIVL